MVVTATLRSGLLRDSGEIERITIPDRASTVRLRLELATSDHKDYRILVETDEGREILREDSLKTEAIKSGMAVIVEIPASRLDPGDYRIKLEGLGEGGRIEGVGSYYFRILNTPR